MTPITSLREIAMRTGTPSASNSEARRRSSRLWAGVFGQVDAWIDDRGLKGARHGAELVELSAKVDGDVLDDVAVTIVLEQLGLGGSRVVGDHV
jgi:hypothetical protein